MNVRPFPQFAGDPEPERPPELHRGQLRFAIRFTEQWGGKFLYVHGVGWHQYDGTRWAACLDGAETRAMKDTARRAYEDLAALEKNDQRQLLKDINTVESRGGCSGALGLAGSLHPCTLAGRELDADPYLVNCANGTVDLRTGHHRASRPEDHLSKVTTAGFDPDAHSDTFTAFIEQVQPDPETRAFIARSLGSALLGRVRDQVLLIWHGTGANGKGTLRDAVLHAMGDYAIETRPELLIAQKHRGSIDDIAKLRLKGSRLAFCSEISEDAQMDEAVMKRLTGGDPIEGKMLYEQSIVFDPTHQLVMMTNHLPRVRGDDPATWRRLLCVPFDVVIPSEQWDLDLSKKLKASPDAVLAWLWHGWLDYCVQGLNPPASVQAATRRYQQDSDAVTRFLADETVVMTGMGQTPAGRLYETFQGWCRAEGEPTEMSKTAFGKALDKQGYQRGSTGSSRVWKSITLVERDRSDDDRGDGW